MSRTMTIKKQQSAIMADNDDQTIIDRGRKLSKTGRVRIDIEKDSQRRKPKAQIAPAKGRRSGDKHLKFKAKLERVQNHAVDACDAQRTEAQRLTAMARGLWAKAGDSEGIRQLCFDLLALADKATLRVSRRARKKKQKQVKKAAQATDKARMDSRKARRKSAA